MHSLERVTALVGVALAAGLVAFALTTIALWRVFREHPAFWAEHKDSLGRLHVIHEAIADYRERRNELPSSLTQLGPPELFRSYVDQEGRIADGWGHPFHYSVRGEDYVLMSYGRDGEPGGTGLDYDISNGDRLPPEAAPTLRQFLLDRPTGGVLLVGAIVGMAALLSVLVLWRPFTAEVSWRIGKVLTDSGETIARPGLSVQEFLTTPAGASAGVEEIPPAHLRATLSHVSIGGYECWIQWEFEDEALRAVSIGVTDATAERLQLTTGHASPPDGPEVTFLEDWVRREVGKRPPVRFRWGEIGQVYDPVAGFARIRFGYRPTRRRRWFEAKLR